MVKKKICLVSGTPPSFLGGMSLYQRNLINYAKKKKLSLKFSWIYPGRKNKKYSINGINCIEIKSYNVPFLKEFDFGRKARKYLRKNYFDFINTHSNWGYCLKKYEKINKQKIIHTFHGVAVPYIKIQLKRFGILKQLALSPLILASYILEKPSFKKADKIICVSEKVKEELKKIYFERKGVKVIRTGVNINEFKKLNKKKSRKNLKLNVKGIYGLYSGRGGYWNKGLDRAINLSKEIYNLNKNYRLVVIGANKNKCRKYLNFPFIEYRGLVERKELPKYYSAVDFFFSLSRYEGGAPTLVVSEAMASGCLVVCAKSAEQEIIKNNENGLIIKDNFKEAAKKINQILENKEQKKKIIKKSKETIKKFSLEKWGKEYLEVLFDEKK